MRFIFLILLYGIPFLGQSQTTAYDLAVTDAIVQFDELKDLSTCKELFVKFEQLSKTHNKDWVPFYYAALIKIKMSMYKDQDADKYADEAIEWILKAKKIQANDEVYCVESLSYSTKLAVHPTWRWFALEQKIKQPLATAMKMNNNNPRIYVLNAMLHAKLPAVLGGNCKTARTLALKAKKLLATNTSNANDKPHWGIKSAEEVLAACPF